MSLQLNTPSLSHRFMATFFVKRVPSPVDMRFQRISGLSREMTIASHREGGDNLGSIHFPERVSHGNLMLERGVVPLTPVTALFNHALGEFSSVYMDVVVMLMNARNLPVCSWIVTNALPVKWQTSDLDATGNAVLIDTLELAYHEMRWLGVRG
ncbi:phage tail protein [Burkholderia sp. SIMBA_062]|uniref:phage tail protein n=1 Tax=Burkholderia sp. SIMBA_062 TaxID=3085803 RepID=UPI003978C101